jgi:hypothetical protein
MKLMPLRYAGNCASCGTRIEQRVQAWYDPQAKAVTCMSCRPVDGQLSVDVVPPVSAAPPAPKRSARTDLQKGIELEQKIAAVFAAAGYQVQTNVVREGRSGSTHEVDVLAEKTDELLTLTIAVECKAWANPIEKDVVAKFDYVRRDLGLGHGVVVSLNGARPGALSAAKELGIVVWGPDEIEPHLGKVSVLGLQNRPMVEEVGFPRVLAADAARQLVEKETGGRLGFGKEEVVYAGDAWIPVSVVQLTLMEVGIVRRKTATSQMWVVYDLIGGTFVTRLDTEVERTAVPLDGPRVEPKLKVVEPAKHLDAVVAKFDKVTSDDAKAKYRGQMAKLGVPDWQVPTTGTSTPFLYPVHLALAHRSGSERIVAIDAYRSRVDADLGYELSKSIAWVRQSLDG